MNYKLIPNSLNDLSQIEKTVFQNRNIFDFEKFMNLNDSVLNSPHSLLNMKLAVRTYLLHGNSGSHIHIIVDSDTDGYTSAAAIYQYTEALFPECKVTYSLHTKKQHGLSKEIEIPEGTKLLILPDAGTNDTEACEELYKKGIDILILDHHEKERENPYAVIVNNQMNDYPNKFLSGVGVVYQFMRAVDEETWNDCADDYLDLVAVGLIADVMDVREPETRFLIDKGLERIRNPFLKALFEKQKFSMRTDFSGRDVQFYIVPLINGMVRSGDSEEKEMMFRSMIGESESFVYRKRSGEMTTETLPERTARLCVNAKSRQKNYIAKHMDDLTTAIKEKKSDQNKVIFANVSDKLESTMTGIFAIKIAEYFGKPCLLLHKQDESVYRGSGRNFEFSPISDFKKFLSDTGLFEFVQGHANAFGAEIKNENIPKAIKLTNKLLKDVDFTKICYVDFILNAEDLTISVVRSLDLLRKYYGTEFSEPLIAIENVEIDPLMLTELGGGKHWKIRMDEGVDLVKFYDTGLIDYFKEHDHAVLNVIGKADISFYNGIMQCQIIISDYEIKE